MITVITTLLLVVLATSPMESMNLGRKELRKGLVEMGRIIRPIRVWGRGGPRKSRVQVYDTGKEHLQLVPRELPAEGGRT